MRFITVTSISKKNKYAIKMLTFLLVCIALISSFLMLPKTSFFNKRLLCDAEHCSETSVETAKTIVISNASQTIQGAINKASDGDTIIVEPGLYHEHLIVNKSIFLIGEDPKSTIIDGHGLDVITIVKNNVVVTGFTIKNGDLKCGIKVKASNTTICNNIIKYNFVGVKLGDEYQGTNGNIVRNNTITKNRYGVFLSHSKQSVVEHNVIVDNKWNGVEIDWGGDNIVCANLISNNVAYGLEIPLPTPSYNNTIYHNNFINNTKGCTSSNYKNSWDDGYPSGGNFWGEYAGVDLKSGLNQNLLGWDGIGDEPYNVDNYVTDRYPLIGRFFTFLAEKGNLTYWVNIISNSTVFNFHFSVNDGIHFQVNGPDGTFGFCRISIPHALIRKPYNITIDGGTPIFMNCELFDNGTHNWIYFTYLHSTHEVVIIPEFPITIFFWIILCVVVFVKFFLRLKNSYLLSRVFPFSFFLFFLNSEKYSSDIRSMSHSKLCCLTSAFHKLRIL